MPHPYEIAAGIAGYSDVKVQGANGDVDATEETLWTPGGAYAYLASAQRLKVSSGSGLDDVGSSGALTVTLYGLDTDYAEIEETVTMTGATPVTTDASFLRVFRAAVRTAGGGGKNAGIISVKNNAGAVTHLAIAVGMNQSQDGIWTVPAGTKLFIADIWGAEANGKKAKLRVYVRPIDEVFQLKFESGINRNHAHHKHTTPMVVPATADIELRGISSAEDADISAGFEGYYKTP